MSDLGASVNLTTARLLEQASDELARLDAVAAIAPRAFAMAFRLDTLVLRNQATPSAARSLVAASVESLHEAMLDGALRAHRDFVAEEERRVRGGAVLTATRIIAAGYAVADPAALDAALRPGGQPRPVLLRAIAVAAALAESRATTESLPRDESLALDDSPALANAVAALLLCGAGVTDELRLLPFEGVEPAARAEALEAWRAADHGPWTTAALSEAARAARARRQSLTDALAAFAADDARLDPLGRAAITARRALAVLRNELAITVPTLSTRLDCSRPAAGDAAERLVAAELATEITGRARDRVFALSAALVAAAIE